MGDKPIGRRVQLRFCICEECGRMFNAVRIDARLCSPRCRQRSKRRLDGLEAELYRHPKK